eukprot:COSAG06_NODE_2521_length_6727_cov_3.568196_5_plen_156_part_00
MSAARPYREAPVPAPLPSCPASHHAHAAILTSRLSVRPFRVFANSPWCIAEDNPALCLQGDDQLQPAGFWSPCRSLACQFNLRPALCLGEADGTGELCALNDDDTACVVESGDCTFTAERDTYLRPLFDSSFFLGWLAIRVGNSTTCETPGRCTS